VVRYFKKSGGKIIEGSGITDAPWVCITPAIKPSELESLSEKLNIPLDFLQDSLDIDERSRYEREDEANLILVNTPIENPEAANGNQNNAAIYYTVPIGIILLPDYIVTITSQNSEVLNRLIDGRVKNFDPADFEGFVLHLFEQNVLRFLYALKDLNRQRNLMETELYNSSRNSELRQLLGIEKSLVYFVTSLSSNELLKMKMKRTDFLGIKDNEEKVDHFEDIIIDNGQALEMANTYTNILGGTMDAFASIISNNLNNVIKRLTMITILLMVPTLITSIFGMNVISGLENSKYAIFIITVIALLVTFLLTWLARRNKWF